MERRRPLTRQEEVDLGDNPDDNVAQTEESEEVEKEISDFIHFFEGRAPSYKSRKITAIAIIIAVVIAAIAIDLGIKYLGPAKQDSLQGQKEGLDDFTQEYKELFINLDEEGEE